MYQAHHRVKYLVKYPNFNNQPLVIIIIYNNQEI